jgi:hypothetical protein
MHVAIPIPCNSNWDCFMYKKYNRN